MKKNYVEKLNNDKEFVWKNTKEMNREHFKEQVEAYVELCEEGKVEEPPKTLKSKREGESYCPFCGSRLTTRYITEYGTNYYTYQWTECPRTACSYEYGKIYWSGSRFNSSVIAWT